MPPFEFILDNPRLKTYNKVSWLAVALNFFSFILISYQLKGTAMVKWPITGAALMGIFVIFYFVRRRLRAAQQFRFSFPFFFALFTWFQLHNYVFAIAMLVLIVLEELSKKPVVLVFRKEKIDFTGFPAREYSWPEFNNVILKDGLLTLDFKNNKLLQATIKNQDVDELSFNAFAKEKTSNQPIGNLSR